MKNGKGDRLPTPNQIKAAEKELEKELRKTRFFQGFSKRNFYFPQEFCSWQKFLFSLSAYQHNVFYSSALKYEDPNEWLASLDPAQKLICAFLMELYGKYSTSFPVYCLSKQLANAFLQTDLPPTFQLKRSHYMGIIFVSDGLLESPSGQKVKWLLFAHRQKGEANFYRDPAYSNDSTKTYPENLLEIFSIGDNYGETWFSVCSLERSTSTNLCHNESLAEKNRKEFVDKIQSIAIQSLFWLQLQEPQDAAIKSNESGNTKAIALNTPTISLPRWIGKDYATKVQRIAASSPTDPTTSQSSKCMHWRRGHYRMQPIGKERAEVKQIWIEPMLINSENVPSLASE